MLNDGKITRKPRLQRRLIVLFCLARKASRRYTAPREMTKTRNEDSAGYLCISRPQDKRVEENSHRLRRCSQDAIWVYHKKHRDRSAEVLSYLQCLHLENMKRRKETETWYVCPGTYTKWEVGCKTNPAIQNRTDTRPLIGMMGPLNVNGELRSRTPSQGIGSPSSRLAQAHHTRAPSLVPICLRPTVTIN